MPSWLIFVLVFVSGFSVMSVELLGGRIMAPYFGSSIYVWGSIITVFMLALSLGYLAGGRLSLRRPSFGKLGLMFLVSGFAVLPLVILASPMMEAVAARIDDPRYGSLLAAAGLFWLPITAMGAISPYAVRLMVETREESGAVAGRLYFVSTLGSALGTLITSFFLVLWFEVNQIFYALSAALFACGAVALLAGRRREDGSTAGVPASGPAGGSQRGKIVVVLASLLGLLMACRDAAAEVVFTKRSLYRNVTVADDGGEVCLQFETVRKAALWQSCMDKNDPDRLVFDYTQMTFAGLPLVPHPKRVLIAGLGGGSIPRVWLKLYPGIQVDVVEIDPAVVDVAYQFFGLPKAKNLTIIEKDARVYVKSAIREGLRYDYVVLDAFTGDYIPEHLMTREFLEECKAILAPGGVLLANTFSRSRLYDSESRTYEAAFGWFLNLKRGSTNRVVLTQNGPYLGRAAYLSYVDQLLDETGAPKPTVDAVVAAALRQLAKVGVDLKDVADMAGAHPDWDKTARVLTDQYAPANLLNQ